MKTKLTLLLFFFCSSIFSDITSSSIDGDWEGWNGENIIKLYDGSIWEQLEYHYNYSYSYSPEVKIYLDYSHPKYKFYKMKVGDDKPVGVMKLK